jgi:hypothetical protein
MTGDVLPWEIFPQTSDEPEDRASFIFEIAAWGASEEQLRAALETMSEDDVRRVCAVSAKVYQVSRDTLYDKLTVGSVRVLPLPRNI